MATKRTCGLPLICLVCGDTARGINFDLMTCMSCKSFFRRHAQKSTIKLQCKLNGNCKITQRTRGTCSACRLNKCFLLGMNQQLIRRWSTNQPKIKDIDFFGITNRNKNPLPTPLPLSLLQNDRSTLTINEWNLLSNIIHAYDETNIISQIKSLLGQQSSLPPKVRSKPPTTLGIISAFFASLQPFIKRSPYFQNLSSDTCRALIQRNAPTFGTLNCFFVLRELNVFDNAAFRNGCNTVYGCNTISRCENFLVQLEPNGTLVKIILLILAFSTNCSIVTPDDPQNIKTIPSAMCIFKIQNILVIMLWKYLLYQYGFIGGVRCFNSLIKYILIILKGLDEEKNEQHVDMVDTIVEETTRVLVIGE